MVQDNAVVKY